MLSDQDNELLCRVGAGTAMGEVFRRFWMPAILASELPEPDAPPKRLRILGEDLVAFRNTEGKVGILEAYCPHKLAPLYWGRNEECGLRCVYHGWKFDTEGRCIDMPNESEESNFKNKVGIKAYPTREYGGAIWIYMGPDDKIPELPQLEWARVPEGYCHLSSWLQRTNWAQGMEGEIDTSHVSFLHKSLERDFKFNGVAATSQPPPGSGWDGAPKLTLKETDYGFIYGGRRATSVPGEYYWRVTQWLAPMYSLIPNDVFPRSGRAYVPVDDEHFICFSYNYRGDRPFTEEEVELIEGGQSFPPRLTPGAYQLPDGYIIDTFLPDANVGNDYRIDRAMQARSNYTGIAGINEQDRAIQESMQSGFGLGPGKLANRAREHLGAADVPVIAMRRILLKMARDLQNGIEPVLAHNAEAYHVRSMSAVSNHETFESLLEDRGGEARATI